MIALEILCFLWNRAKMNFIFHATPEAGDKLRVSNQHGLDKSSKIKALASKSEQTCRPKV